MKSELQVQRRRPGSMSLEACWIILALPLTFPACLIHSLEAVSHEDGLEQSKIAGHVLTEVRIPEHGCESDGEHIFVDSGGGLWFRGGRDSIYRIDGTSGICLGSLRIRDLPGFSLSSVHETSDGLLWLYSSYGRVLVGISNWESGDSEVRQAELRGVRAVMTDHRGFLWIVDGEGLSRVADGARERLLIPPAEIAQSHLSLPSRRDFGWLNPRIVDLLDRAEKYTAPSLPYLVGMASASGTIWMATRKAILSVDPTTNLWRLHGIPEVAGVPQHLAVSDEGYVWTIDNLGMLSRFDPETEQWRHFDIHEAAREIDPRLDAKLIIGMAPSAGKMFIALFGGILAVSMDSGAIEAHRRTSGWSSVIRDRSGRIWVRPFKAATDHLLRLTPEGNEDQSRVQQR